MPSRGFSAASEFVSPFLSDDSGMEGEAGVVQKRSIVEEARSAARALVEREMQHGGRMVAYLRVAQMVGASEIWMRRFVNGYQDASPNLVVGFNIFEQYRRISTKRE